MARKQLRITPFARFLLFMLLAVPAIYFGVTYYKGEDGMGQVKELFQSDDAIEANGSELKELRSEVEKLREERDYWRKRAEALERSSGQ